MKGAGSYEDDIKDNCDSSIVVNEDILSCWKYGY